jgi:hypothetical protein
LKLIPTNGPWNQVVQVLWQCYEAFNQPAPAVKQTGMPANCITYVSHMLVDERVIHMLVKAAEGVDAS